MRRDNSIARMRETLDLAGSELEILHRICQSISSSLDLEEVLREIIDLVTQVTRGDSCLLYLLDELGECLVLRASKNPHPRIIGRIALKVGEGITGWVAREAQPVALSRNAGKDARFKLFHRLPEDRYEAFLSVPIVAPTDRVIGVINVQHRRAHRHSEQEVTLLSIIGHQVGAAIQNARLYQETRKQATHLAALARVGRLVASGEYLEEMLQRIVDFAAEVVHADACVLHLIDEKRQELALRAARLAGQGAFPAARLLLGQDLLSRVAKERRPIVVQNLMSEPGYPCPDFVTSQSLAALLAVPLEIQERAVGLIHVYTVESRIFSPEDIRLLATIANLAALAIENTRLMVEARESRQALEDRRLVERAKGIVQSQSGLSEKEAYRRLQQQSMRSRRSMREIAEAIILASEMASRF